MDFEKYKNEIPWPKKGDADFEEKKLRYSNREHALIEEFKKDLFQEFEVTDNPKAEKCYRLAWEHGHSSGLADVASYFGDFVELIR